MAIFSRLKYNTCVTSLMSYTTFEPGFNPGFFYSTIIKPGRNAGLSFSHPVNARLKRAAPLTLRPVHAGLAAHV